MPNRYEREIEEILRNLEQTDPKPGSGQKVSGRLQRMPSRRVSARRRASLSWHLSTSEWLLVTAIVMALIAGGYAHLVERTDIISTTLASIGAICIILVAFSQFIFRARRDPGVRYGNITITPLRRGFLGTIKTRLHLFMLKLRYRRKRQE